MAAKKRHLPSAEDLANNVRIRLLDRFMSTFGLPLLGTMILALLGWTYHSIDDTRTAITKLDGSMTTLSQHVQDADSAQNGVIDGLRQWLRGLSDIVDKLRDKR
jgi:hypothetical protein